MTTKIPVMGLASHEQLAPHHLQLVSSGRHREALHQRAEPPLCTKICYWTKVWLLAAQKPLKRLLVGRQVNFISDASNWAGRADTYPTSHSPIDNQGKSFYRQKESYMRKQCRQLQTVIWKLVIGGLTSVILVILGTVNLQFQGRFVLISLKLILGTVAAYVMAIVWSPCN